MAARRRLPVYSWPKPGHKNESSAASEGDRPFSVAADDVVSKASGLYHTIPEDRIFAAKQFTDRA
jgi:hypothetical protein